MGEVTLSSYVKGKMVQKSVTVEKVAQILNMDRATLYRKLSYESLDTFNLADFKQLINFLSINISELQEFF